MNFLIAIFCDYYKQEKEKIIEESYIAYEKQINEELKELTMTYNKDLSVKQDV